MTASITSTSTDLLANHGALAVFGLAVTVWTFWRRRRA